MFSEFQNTSLERRKGRTCSWSSSWWEECWLWQPYVKTLCFLLCPWRST